MLRDNLVVPGRRSCILFRKFRKPFGQEFDLEPEISVKMEMIFTWLGGAVVMILIFQAEGSNLRARFFLGSNSLAVRTRPAGTGVEILSKVLREHSIVPLRIV